MIANSNDYFLDTQIMYQCKKRKGNEVNSIQTYFFRYTMHHSEEECAFIALHRDTGH